MKRIIPCLLVLVLCITCLVSPAAAASFDIDQIGSYELLDYVSLNSNGTNTFSVTGDYDFVLPSYEYSVFRYVDILVKISGGTANFTASMRSSASGASRSLSVLHIDNDLYRIVGQIPAGSYRNFYLNISSDNDIKRGYTFLSFQVSYVASDHYNLSGDLKVDTAFGIVNGTWSAGSSGSLSFPAVTDNYSSDYDFRLRPYQCEKYDYVFLTLFLQNVSYSSIHAYWDGMVVPLELLSVTGSGSDQYVSLVLDVSTVARTHGIDTSIPVSLTIRGEYFSSNAEIFVQRCYGVVSLDEPSKFRVLLSKLESLFGSLQDKLDDLFGTDDTAVDTADKTQEEIDVLVNTQLVGAIEDWNTNIEVVETGYDSALTKATPALGWLASLADGIFSGMGWFGNIYFLVGLISVIMLVLSKSGLARSVSRFRRNE